MYKLGINVSIAYANYAAGNSLEVILLDIFLFNDYNEDIGRYIIFTLRLDHNNPLKFLLFIPIRVLLAFYYY